MLSKQYSLSTILIVGLVFLGGLATGVAVVAHAPTVSAQAVAAPAPPSTLPPIFQVGGIVTFGANGPELRVYQVYGDWIFVAQRPRSSGGMTTDWDAIPNRFWCHVPSITESWTEVVPR